LELVAQQAQTRHGALKGHRQSLAVFCPLLAVALAFVHTT
jgi:hypothetical protein